MPELFQTVPMSAFKDNIPDMPGVYMNNNGASIRVPYNCFSILGLPLPVQFDNSIGQAKLVNALASPFLKPSVPAAFRAHQHKCLAPAFARDGFSLWSPPGSGKTLMGLVWSAWWARGPRVVITKAAARSTWVEECEKWTNMKPVVLYGQTPNVEIGCDPTILYITSWETLIYWKDALVKARPSCLVMDEIHMGKASKRAKPVIRQDGTTEWESMDNMTAAARAVAGASGSRLGLTATPVPNGVRDLWAQLDLCEPWQWGGGLSKFGMAYCDGHHNGYGMEYKGYSNGDELTDRLKFSKHRITQASISEHMPPKRRQVTRLERSEQDKPESGFARDIRAAGKQAQDGSEEGRAALFEVLLQEAATRKRKYVVEQVTDALRSGLKVVVFTGRRRDCDVLGEAITKAAPANAKVWTAHGGAPDGYRDQVRWEYMGNAARGIPRHPGPCCIVGTGDAWGESVNLQDTDTAFFVMLPYTPRAIRQWEGRFQRMGGTRSVLIRYILAIGTVDEDVADTLLGKLPPVVEIVNDEELDGMEQTFRPREVGDLLARMQAIADARDQDEKEESKLLTIANTEHIIVEQPTIEELDL